MLWRRCLKGLDRDWDLSTIRTVCRVKPFVQMASAPCQHSSLMWGMCVVCGMKVDVANGTNLIVSGGVKISQSESEAARIQELKIESLKKTRKLALVLDLDHTLLHSVQVEGPKPAQSAHPGFPDIHHLPIEELINGTVKHLVMKKRPYLDKFLAQAHEICQMTVYTAGTRRYAEAVVQIIDPQNKYFKGRVVSRDDDKVLNNKSLNKIFHNDPSMAVIIDDREDVWRGPQSEHLLLVRPYAFFSPPVLREIGIGGPVLREANNGPGMLAATPINANIPSPVISLHESPGKVMQMVPQATMAYSEGDDQLPRCLQILRDLHARFFAQQAASNVATLLRDMRKDILRGCVLTFSGLIPMNEPRPEQHFLHRTATSLGATVTATLQPQTTHLVCINLQTAKAQAVMQQKRETQIFVVHPDWLVYCKWALARAQETSFLLTAVGPSIQPLSAAIVAPGGDNDAGEVAVKKRKLDESVLAQDNELALAAKRPHLGEATGTAVVASGEGAVVLVGDEEGGEAVVLPVDTAALADMDEAVGSCEVQNVSRTSTHPTEFIDLTLEDDGEDEDEVVPENLAVEDSEEEGDGDCRVYYDRHAVAHYADDDDDDDDLLARRHGDEDYSRYDSFNDDEDEEVVEEEGRGETVLRSPVPSDDDEDEALDLLAVHMRRQQAARRQNGTDSPSAADSSGDE